MQHSDRLNSPSAGAGVRRSGRLPPPLAALVHGALLCGGLGLVSGAGCSGGGSRSNFAHSARLLAVEFLDPNDVNPEGDGASGANLDLAAAPQSAPLTQQIRLQFSAPPDPARINTTVLSIVDAANLPVAGRFSFDGAAVTFTPRLPLRAVATTATGATDDGGTGLRFDGSYLLRVGRLSFSFIADVDPALRARHPDPLDPKGILVQFRTQRTPTVDAFRGVAARAPQLVAVRPVDGASGVSPNLHSDPDRRFAPSEPFRLEFDAPLEPSPTQLNDTVFGLIDLDDRPATHPLGLPLGIDVALVRNEIDGATVEVRPRGILPLGHLLALQYDRELKGLAETGTPAGGPRVAATFSVAEDPGGTLRDAIVERFDDDGAAERDIDEIGNGNVPADWNVENSSIVQAALVFDGTGVLGRFMPIAPRNGDTLTVVLDTASQSFPLLDGSTPDVPPGLVVNGGVFHFSEIDIPDGVEIRVAGSNPLVFKCTGSVRIAGTIRLDGGNGSSEYAYDSAITSLPGGSAVAGGGIGGEAHPVVFHPPDEINYLTMVSPSWSGQGFGLDPVDGVMKRIGGSGAQCGILDQPDKSGNYQTDFEWTDCNEFRQGNGDCKIAGGGGGSSLRIGKYPQDSGGNRLDGNGNVVPDGTGRFLLDVAKEHLLAGDAGNHPFAPDGTPLNDFYGRLGQLTRIIGGQGGGGGGSLTDSYFCGVWCDEDPDPANDSVCANGDRLPDLRNRSSSVGDSRGGGGGGGGGALLVEALGAITVVAGALIDASGGSGGGGEGLGCSYWGGGGGGGAGGMVVLQSAEGILVEASGVIDVMRGLGHDAAKDTGYLDCGNAGYNPGDGGEGGNGLIQLQVPAGSTATVVQPGTSETNGSLRPPNSWIDSGNTLAPVEFKPESIALSKWYDFGRVIERAPGGTNPVFAFAGTDVHGWVVTDAEGDVVDPAGADIEVGYLGQVDPSTGTYLDDEEPRADWIPPNATVRVEFQGADAIAPGSKEVDPATLTPWSGNVAIASGRQFLRWRITFDLTADGSALMPRSRRPIVERIEVHAEF